jgi:hypothetical protein
MVDAGRYLVQIYWLHLLARYLPNMCLTLKMEAESYWETSLKFYRTIRYHIADNVWTVVEFMEMKQFTNAVTRCLPSTQIKHSQITKCAIIIAYVHKRRMSHHLNLEYYVICRLRDWTYSVQRQRTAITNGVTPREYKPYYRGGKTAYVRK